MRFEPRRGTLLIEFWREHGVYRYFGVTRREWDAFLAAESKGTHLNREFKRQEHPYERLAVAEERRVRRSRGREGFRWPSLEELREAGRTETN